jgi:hypothetical protein
MVWRKICKYIMHERYESYYRMLYTFPFVTKTYIIYLRTYVYEQLRKVQFRRPCSSQVYIYTQPTVRATLCLGALPTNMAVTLLFVFLTIAGLTTGRNFNLHNNLGHTVWVGILGNPDKGQPNNGGFALNPGERVSMGKKCCGWVTWSDKGKKLH